MKHLKTYEKYGDLIGYIIIDEYNDLWLDQIIDIDEENNKMRTKTLKYYNSSTNKYSHPKAEWEINNLDFDKIQKFIIYKTHIHEDAKREMRKMVSLKRKANQYNL